MGFPLAATGRPPFHNMQNCKSLYQLCEGQCGYVSELCVTGSMRRRLLDLGVVKGACIECVQISPYGDPTAYCIKGAIIALRQEDACQILIQPAISH